MKKIIYSLTLILGFLLLQVPLHVVYNLFLNFIPAFDSHIVDVFFHAPPDFTDDMTDFDVDDNGDGVELEGMDMPSPDDYLSAQQKDGKPLGADEIYKETWLWLKERGCERLVNKRLLESYSEAFARYIQCSEAVSKYGMLGKHPTTGAAIASPFTQLLMNFQKQANLLWYEIYDIVKQNCTEPFEGSPQDSVMEQLLRSRRNM